MSGTTITIFNMNAFTGTVDFSVNNPTMTFTQFAFSGSSTRTLKLGSSVLNISGAVNGTSEWNAATATGLTFTPGTATINMTGAPAGAAIPVFAGGGLTYPTVNFTGGAYNGSWSITGANTFTNIGITAGGRIGFPAGSTTTITNSFTIAGSSQSTPVLMNNGAIAGGGSVATISTATGTATCTYCAITDITFSGGATFSGVNSVGSRTSGMSFSSTGGGGGSIIGGN